MKKAVHSSLYSVLFAWLESIFIFTFQDWLVSASALSTLVVISPSRKPMIQISFGSLFTL